MLRRIDERVSVAEQILPEQVAALATEGVAMIVNNRPDGEEPGQPSASEVEAAARAAGIDYRHIPVAGGFSFDQVVEMGEALESAKGTVLAFCKSGTRSIFLWALARAEAGADPQELMRKAAHAGYDLTPIQRYLLSPRT